MTGAILLLLLLVCLAAAGAISATRRVALIEETVRTLEARLHVLETCNSSAEPRVGAPPAIAAPVPPEPPAPEAARDPVSLPPAQVEPRFSLESLVGGRLPIWIGGVALVLAGFFLVRYSIESGLLGPGSRTLLAALFGALLIAGSEGARRLPATADDPRIAQALAGAGIASFYATLYMAAALYHLIPPLAAFVLMLVVTALALGLALRHGPPTALMALAGGFIAPLVAGFDAAGVGPLLVYLGLFVAALFALAAHRGWGWLALGASFAGFAWIFFLLAMLGPNDLPGVGAFAVLLAAGASAALPATGLVNPWPRLAPLLGGFVALIALAPALDFGALAWSFYLVLAGATLFLAWRHPLYLPGALAALALLLLLEALALLQPEHAATPLAAVAAAMLFGVPGHLLARRSAGWVAIALLAGAGPLLVAMLCGWTLLDSGSWGGLALIAAGTCASLAWRLRDAEQARLLVAATAVAALLAAIGLALPLPRDWVGLAMVAVMLALAGWARLAKAPALFALPALAYGAALGAAAPVLIQLGSLIADSLAGGMTGYRLLPPLGDAARLLAPPALAATALLALDPRQFGRHRANVAAATVVLALLLAYALAKQPLAIATPEAFATWGFVERALITQALLGTGWLVLRRTRATAIGTALLMLGLFRIGWFDLLVLNPLWVPQAVGSLPLANAAVLHAGAAAFWLWTLPQPRARPVALALTLVAVLAAVRQATHGTLLTGGIASTENGGYSAALLALALFWLWRGIGSGSRTLRIAGLALLTLVTFKVFLIDAAALDGVLRILSFLGLGLALIGIGWAYGRFLGKGARSPK